MTVYRVKVEQSDGWLAARAVEDDSIHTQGKTLDEITENIREVVKLVCDDSEIQIESVIPSDVRVA